MTNFRGILFAAVAAALLLAVTPALAQAVKQIALNEKQVEGFLAAQKDLAPLQKQLEASKGKPNAKLQAQLDATAKKNGFSSWTELDDVAGNITMVMAGFDPKTKEFTEPRISLQKELEAAKVDKTMSAKERAEAIKELNEALAEAEEIKNKDNIELVKKYYDRIDAAMQAQPGPAGPGDKSKAKKK